MWNFFVYTEKEIYEMQTQISKDQADLVRSLDLSPEFLHRYGVYKVEDLRLRDFEHIILSHEHSI